MKARSDKNIEPVSEVEQRLDKWLKIVRLFKTRALAAKACDERRVKVNGNTAKPGKLIRIGDSLTIRKSGGKFINLDILGISQKSISGTDAKLLYNLHQPKLSEESKDLLAFYQESVKEIKPKYKGRPTKKDRRRLERLKDDKLPWL